MDVAFRPGQALALLLEVEGFELLLLFGGEGALRRSPQGSVVKETETVDGSSHVIGESILFDCAGDQIEDLGLHGLSRALGSAPDLLKERAG